jgi:hypothetical protein
MGGLSAPRGPTSCQDNPATRQRRLIEGRQQIELQGGRPNVRNKMLNSAVAALVAVPLAASLSFGSSWFSHNSSTKSMSINLIYTAQVGSKNHLKAGQYRVEFPLRAQRPQVKFYQDGNLVATATARVKHIMAKNQQTEVYFNKTNHRQVVTEIRPAGTKEALLFTSKGKKKAGV